MSLYIYSVLEQYNNQTLKWESIGLYEKNSYSGNKYKLAQIIGGGRDAWYAISTGDGFTSAETCGLDGVDRVINDAQYLSIPLDASLKARKMYRQFGIVIDNGRAVEFPRCVVYRLRDIDLIRKIAMGSSKEETEYYEEYFEPIRQALLLALRVSDTAVRSSDIRMIIWSA